MSFGKTYTKPATTMKTSSALNVGAVYTREDLKSRFGITDATINTGVFQPQGHGSVWLFVTERKTPDRTQFADKLDGDVLHWQGQMAGRKDHLVIEHLARGLELLLFYRVKKYEHPGAGFRYEGRFNYVNHSGSSPASFILQRADTPELDLVRESEEKNHAFDVSSIEDARAKTLAQIVRRQGQPAFRRGLLKAYEGRCAITGCDFSGVLEAAHIYPYKGGETNSLTNGLLLRADIHTLFDLGYISIDPDTFKVRLAPSLSVTAYSEVDGKVLRLPVSLHERPSKEALRWHFEGSSVAGKPV